MIDGVQITRLRKIPDERGGIYHMLKESDPHFIKFGEIYFSIAYPGVVKGWHEHTKQTQNYAVIDGMIKLVLFDNRKDSKTFNKVHELFIGEENYSLITIPTGIIMGYKCIGTKKSILANCSTLTHDPNEMINYDPLGNKVPYKWDLKFK
jgi:dTDP-4-dehydrorhamnose 3,5-epimerase|tara:strand:- start:1739 stop:2188 length:450 start_codon:yes stop_codon:yes gene_type:complete